MSVSDVRREQLDRDLAAVQPPPPPPRRGWVRAIRESLGMSMRQLALRLGSENPTLVAGLQRGEADETVTLARLRRAAEALDCELHYVLVPKQGTLKATLDARARDVARAQLRRANLHMHLEDQAVPEALLAEQIDVLAAELRAKPRALWEDAP